MKSVAEVKKIIDDFEKDLLKKPGVNAIAIGPKIVAGKKQNEIAIKVFVTKKRKSEHLADNERIPKEIEGVSTDVIEQDLTASSHSGSSIDHDTDPHDRMIGGINVGTPDEIGTLGAIVLDETGQAMILGASHVLAPFMNSSSGAPVCNPGEDQTRVIATLHDKELNDTMDAAVAILKDPANKECKIFELGAVNGYIDEKELNNMMDAYIAGGPPIRVQKRGITTRKTSGTIEDINFGTINAPITLNYSHDLPPGKFQNQILIVPDDNSGNKFSGPGDSGSCICTPLDDSRKIVALLAGGLDNPNPDGKFRSIASHIQPVLNRFHIDICKT
jgi:hypothetical protein